MRRLFLAAWPDVKTMEVLAAYQRQLKGHMPAAVRWTDPAHWHLTLHFLGDVEESAISHLQFRLRSQNWRLFSSCTQPLFTLYQWPSVAAPRVIALGSETVATPLAAVQTRLRQLVEAEGLWADPRSFVPHVTLARLGSGRLEGGPTTGALAIPFPFTRFHLVESRQNPAGSDYERLADFDLAAPANPW